MAAEGHSRSPAPTLVENLLDLQRHAWRRGERVLVEGLLEGHATIEAHTDGLLDLICNEVDLRTARGETLQLDEYQRRFPQLADELARLFEVHVALGPLTPTLYAPADRTLGSAGTAVVGRPQVPGHEILGELGRGGMGVVYKARHLRLNRLVAIKMILAGDHAHPDMRARFSKEAEAVARLRHPGIVQIYEIGDADGRPYFSLEYMEGGSLAARLNGTPLPARHAAALVETLARTMDVAHRQGIIHRDLKPANILLEIADGKLNGEQSKIPNLQSAIPKITDFGLAKSVESGQSYSEQGAIIGTPSYMPPEQARGKDIAGPLTPAADIYSLGAILYELLTGRPPFRGATPMETLQLVLAEEPVPPRRLQPKLPRDLETICLKCLQKDPRQRYAGAGDLADDLHRFQTGEAILARPVSGPERLVRWARRQPALAALVAVSVAAAISLLVGGWIYQSRLEANQDRLEAALHRAEAKEDEVRREREVAEGQRTRAEGYYRKILEAVNRSVRRLRDDRLGHTLVMDEVREEFLLDALQFFQGFLKDSANPDRAIRREVAQAYRQTATIQHFLKHDMQAENNFRQALELYQQLYAASSKDAVCRDDLAACYHIIGFFFDNRMQWDPAEEHYRKAWRLWEDLVKDYPNKAEYRSQLAVALNSLGNLYHNTGRRELAQEFLTRALTLWTDLNRADPKNPDHEHGLALVHHNLGGLHQHAGRNFEARVHLLQALKLLERHARAFPKSVGVQSELATCLNSLGCLYSNVKERAQAEKYHRDAIAIRTAVAHGHPSLPDAQEHLAVSYFNLANLYQLTDQAAKAEAPYIKAIELRAPLTRDYPKITSYAEALAESHFHLGMVYEKINQLSLAENHYETGRAILEPLVRDNPKINIWAISLGKCYFHLAHLANKQGEPKQALKWSTEAIRVLAPALRKDPQHVLARVTLRGAYALRAGLNEAAGNSLAALADLYSQFALDKPPPPAKASQAKAN